MEIVIHIGNLYIRPTKAKIKYKVCLLYNLALKCEQPLYLSELLESLSHSICEIVMTCGRL